MTPISEVQQQITTLQGESNPEATDHRLRVYSDVVQLIASTDNPTPMVRVNRLNPSPGFEIYLKLERYNPFGSIKDRIALEMLRGLNRGDKTIVEPSSGNTGIALTGLANAMGIPVQIAVPSGIPEEKKLLLRLLGAELLEADDALCPMFPSEGARGLVNALIKSPATKDRFVSPNQYENPLNVEAHYRNTGPEIWRQTQGRVAYFFAGLGTCGTISGVGRFLKEQNPDIRIIGVEPAVVNHKLPGLKKISNLAPEYVPKILDRSVLDEVVEVADDTAFRTALEMARRDGILVGPTTGAVLAAALNYGKTRHGLAVVISPDDALKYLSFYKEFLEAETGKPAERTKEFDLSNLVCPLSKIKAVEALNDLSPGETARLLLADRESFKNTVQEFNRLGLKQTSSRDDAGRFVLMVTR
ncbi:MAG: pyridoxal-phosphate dependent enzyme [Chloroflexota bacterium]